MKKCLALSLCAILIVTLSACSPKEPEADAKGTCGGDLKWYYLDDTLTIIGTGPMKDYSDDSSKVPWSRYKTFIKNVIFEDGCTTISTNAFNGYSNLVSVTLPNTLIEIESYAFFGCTDLSSITIPDSVTTIADGAFGNSGLTSITIPKNVEALIGNPFIFCDNLASINNQSANFVLENNVLFSSDKTKLIACPASKTGTYQIPAGVKEIGVSAFIGCTKLTAVSFSNGLETIGDGAFWACTSIKTIKVPDSVTSIGNSAFRRCENLTSAELPEGLKTIGISLFSDCYRLKSVTIPNSVKEIGDGAFLNCQLLTSVTIPDGVTKIGPQSFAGVIHVYYNGTATGAPWGALAIN